MANFQENVNFNSDLLIEYLDILKNKEEKEEFNKLFSQLEEILVDAKEKLTSVEKMRKVQELIEYKKSILKAQTI